MPDMTHEDVNALVHHTPASHAYTRASAAATAARAGSLAVGEQDGTNGRVEIAPVKRALDILGALVGLVLFAPFFAVVALLIKRDSPGPVFFAQERVGQGQRPLRMLKFRTMFDGNDPAAHRTYVTRLIAEGPVGLEGDSGAFKIENDPRVTHLGRILRRTSIDELPQLVNVLRGDMSLVGPRPPLPYEVELYSAREMGRLTAVPGMTGLWQVSGRTRLTFDQMVDLDLEYIDTWSFERDVRILWKTITVVFGREGAW